MGREYNAANNLTAEIPPRRRIYAFKDLPPDVQENLLGLQNSDGDFLRIRYVASYTSGVLLFVFSIAFLLFIPELAAFLNRFEYYGSDVRWIVVFGGGTFIFTLCYSYLLWRFVRGRRSPMKRGAYLTPTQVIEAADGLVRYRELKDTSEISVDKFQGGWRTSLDLKFPDGDLYKYNLYMNKIYDPVASQLAYAKEWQEKAGTWRNEAIGAAQRGDTAFFDSRDIIRRSAAANLSVRGRYFPPLLLMRLLWVLSFAMLGFVLIILLGFKISM